MAFNLENMTVDYKKLLNVVPTQRMQLAQSGALNDLISALTPGQLSSMFPSYYRNQLPDVGLSSSTAGISGAMSGAGGYRPSGGGSYAPTPSTALKKMPTPEEKAVQELIKKAGLSGMPGPLSETGFMDPRTSGKLRPEILEKYKDQNFPVTIRNNNMGAVSLADESNTFVTGMEGFIGMTPRPKDEGGYYAKFSTPEHGVAAASKNLENYGSKGINTPYMIVKKWARDGNQNYIDTIVSYLRQAGYQVNPDSQLDLSDPNIRMAILKGKSAFESGAGMPVYNDDVFQTGVNYTVQSAEAAAEKIKELESVLGGFDPAMIGQLDERLQKWYNDSNRTELQRKQFEASLAKLGADQFNQTMKEQPINTPTLSAVAAEGAPTMLPVGGSMAGKSITSEEAVPFSGGSYGSRSFGGPRGTNQLHTGVDIPGQPGDPVLAVDNGVIVDMRKSPSGYGYTMDIQYPDGTIHRMAHLGTNENGWEGAFSEGLKPGDTVSAGQRIGTLGYSGNAGAEFPHVHYEVIKPDYYEKYKGRPPGRISGRTDASMEELESGRIDPREWYAKRQEEYANSVKQKAEEIRTASPVSAAGAQAEEISANSAPALATGGLMNVPPGENIVGLNTTTGKTEFVANDRENIRIDPATLENTQQMPMITQEDTQRLESPNQPLATMPERPMQRDNPDPNFYSTMGEGDAPVPPSQLRAANRARLYGENSGSLVNGHFS